MRAVNTSLLVFAAFSMWLAWPIRASYSETDPGIIKAHGQYSEAYRGDWSTLPNGKDMARKDPADRSFETLSGDDAKHWYSDQDRVHISGESLLVTWPGRDYDN